MSCLASTSLLIYTLVSREFLFYSIFFGEKCNDDRLSPAFPVIIFRRRCCCSWKIIRIVLENDSIASRARNSPLVEQNSFLRLFVRVLRRIVEGRTRFSLCIMNKVFPHFLIRSLRFMPLVHLRRLLGNVRATLPNYHNSNRHLDMFLTSPLLILLPQSKSYAMGEPIQ